MLIKKVERAYFFVHYLRPLKDDPRYTTNDLVEKKDVVASHSWRAETFPVVLHDGFVEEGIDPLRVLALLNVHDWVEVESGGVEALGARDEEAKRRREKEMQEKLLAQFSDSGGEWVSGLLREFMDQETKEAKVAKALENLESNMHIIEEVKPILDPEHRQRTTDYITRRRGISKVVDLLIDIQLAEIDRIVSDNK